MKKGKIKKLNLQKTFFLNQSDALPCSSEFLSDKKIVELPYYEQMEILVDKLLVGARDLICPQLDLSRNLYSEVLLITSVLQD